MKTRTSCIPCFIRQAHDALQQTMCEDEDLILQTLRSVMRAVADFPAGKTPPAMGQIIHRIVREKSENSDPYAAIKAESNRLALRLADEARPVISGAIDPFRMAVRFSIAGNILDFALADQWNRLDLRNFIEHTRLHPLDDTSIEQLRQAVDQVENILILGDNAGETVFDRLLIEQMAHAKITYAVKGSPVINDATIEDARTAGLDQVAELLENGSDAPGTILEDCSPEFRKRFDDAELIIAKGQANYETLSQVDRPLYFLTQVKCPVIGDSIGEPVGAWVIRRHTGGTT